MLEDCDFDFKIAIVGLGLIGASYAMALKKLNAKHIIGIDKNSETLNKALHMGIIDSAYDEPGKYLKDVDFVIIALYPNDTINFIKANIQNFKTNVIITDTSGVKEMVMNSVDSFLPQSMQFIGGHPMAGREYKGIEYADEDIFKGANYIITPSKRNKKSSIDFVANMAMKFGCKNVEYISPHEHDSMIAYTSQLPHAIATALMNQNIDKKYFELFIGGSFKDATRVAFINSKLWTELFTMNSDKLIDEIEKFKKSLDRIKDDIENNNTVDLEQFFKNSSTLRKKIN
ncbi:prephenate dehydrogenase [Clostridium algifaecis]|uniref:Prephenate dehydrogenase n=1 Tax=Clostridium algifaecis TaxID=1472040 RepID=A0ABS4KUZ2_9CLOT|nr:prephenate dehydrogenase [Clostridium algifaecis]MBP2032664.1 prephenate dehydrogenase [Clostridium algifaecis]